MADVALAGICAATSTGSGALSIAVALRGASAGVSTVAADLKRRVGLTGTAAGRAGGAGAATLASEHRREVAVADARRYAATSRSEVATYLVGDTVRVSATFKLDGVESDPGSVLLFVKKPSGSFLSPAPTVVKDAVGRYHADFLATEAKSWQFKFRGTSPLIASAFGSFLVAAEDFAEP